MKEKKCKARVLTRHTGLGGGFPPCGVSRRNPVGGGDSLGIGYAIDMVHGVT